MHFKFALLGILIHMASGIFAASPYELFKTNRDLICSERCYYINGIYFGIGKAMARTENSASENFARKKAVLNAQNDLIITRAIEGIVWPKGLSESTIVVLKKITKDVIELKVKVSGIEVLTTKKVDDTTYIAVVSASKESLSKVPRISIEEISRQILNPYWLRRNFEKYPEALYEFYRTQRDLPSELANIPYDTWTNQQIDLFCGIFDKPEKSVSNLGEKISGVDSANKDALTKGVINVNENETIGF